MISWWQCSSDQAVLGYSIDGGYSGWKVSASRLAVAGREVVSCFVEYGRRGVAIIGGVQPEYFHICTPTDGDCGSGDGISHDSEIVLALERIGRNNVHGLLRVRSFLPSALEDVGVALGFESVDGFLDQL